MKIVIIGNNDHKGGLIVHYEYLAKFLKNNNFELFCININNSGYSIFDCEEVKEYSIPYKPISIIDKIAKLLKVLKCSIRIRKFDPDLYISTGLGYSNIFIAKALKSSTFKIQQEVIFDATLDNFRKNIIKTFDVVAVQTESMIDNFKLNVSKNIKVEYLPCFTRSMISPSNSINIKKNHNINLSYFGRLAPNKGLTEFLKNTKEILLSEQITLDIYGKGNEYTNIKNTIEKYSLGQNVRLRGYYSDEDFPNLIYSYDALILPSLYNEGLPLVLLESMFYGKPVFASKMGSIPELSKECHGIYISEFDKHNQIKNFSEFILKLRSNSFDSKSIKKVHDEKFSNQSFEKVWKNMLKSPKQYFKN
jgi:glycosyltransferase involved in cell wall biosynthesis